mmetsp:Transcript_14484/g.54680  ORF Transcript_14484/g.54680 Transcript_14484/m.54680 type:complete len:214 (+) Transcript_14484:214-855(+)
MGSRRFKKCHTGCSSFFLLFDLRLPGHAVPYRCEVRMHLRFLRRQPFHVIEPEKLGHEIHRLFICNVRVPRANELGPGLLREVAEERLESRVKLQIISVEVLVQLVRSEDLRNLHQLVVVVGSVEEGLLPEDHSGKHAAQAPHVQGVVILAEIHEQLGSLEVPARDSDVVLSPWVIELREAPVDQPKLPLAMVDHDVVRLDVAMHDAVGVAEV